MNALHEQRGDNTVGAETCVCPLHDQFGFQAAEAALAATVSELTDVLPKLTSCGKGLIGKRAWLDTAMAGAFVCRGL